MTASVQTLSYHAFLVEMEWLFELVDKQVEHIAWTVASHAMHVPRLARRVGGDVVPFYLAGDIKSVFEFARGSIEVSADFVDEVIDTVADLLFTAPMDRAPAKAKRRKVREMEWERLGGRALATILLAARGRARCLDDEWPRLIEVQALTGLSRARIERLGVDIRPGEDDGEECDPDAVLALLERVDKDDDDNI